MDVLYTTSPAPDLEIEVLHEVALVLFSAQRQTSARAINSASSSAKSHPASASLKAQITLQNVATLPLIVPIRPNAIRLLIDTEMARIGCKPNIVIEIDGLNSIRDLVRAGMGFAILSPYAVRNFQAAHAFVIPLMIPPKLVSQLTLVTSSQRHSTETHRARWRSRGAWCWKRYRLRNPLPS